MRKPKRKRMGRPPLPEDQRLSVRITLLLTQGDWTELERSAARGRVTPAQLIRKRIRASAS